jgi:YaiO family outer membrane protein
VISIEAPSSIDFTNQGAASSGVIPTEVTANGFFATLRFDNVTPVSLLRLAVFSASVIATTVTCATRAAAQNDTDVSLLDNVYAFTAAKNDVGPWYSLKLSAVHDFAADTLTIRAVNGFHDQAEPQHGEFVRVEDYHRCSPAIVVKAALGSGSGYQPQRSSVLEVSAALPGQHIVSLAAGGVLTTNHNASYQRIVALGADIATGAISANVRYYRATISSGVYAPPSFELLASDRVTRGLSFGLIADAGGEVGGDRTASQLPTSSGLFGPALGLSAVGGSGRLRVTGAYQEGDYRHASTGASAYRQHVVGLGLTAST